MDTSNRVCRVCRKLVVGYTRHIIDSHADLITESREQVISTFGISNRTSQIVRHSVGKLKKLKYTCPRCGMVVRSMKNHLAHKHSAEIAVVKGNGLSNTNISKMLFNGWCSEATMWQAAKQIKEKKVDVFIPKPVVIICEDEDGSIRMMKRGECGIGIAMSL